MCSKQDSESDWSKAEVAVVATGVTSSTRNVAASKEWCRGPHVLTGPFRVTLEGGFEQRLFLIVIHDCLPGQLRLLRESSFLPVQTRLSKWDTVAPRRAARGIGSDHVFLGGCIRSGLMAATRTDVISWDRNCLQRYLAKVPIAALLHSTSIGLVRQTQKRAE